MFLKNVLPAFAMHTEWRSYGPTRTFSMPLCFDDSSSVTSTTGTLTPVNVQMIIDSFRTTQSSLNMNDENGGTLQSGNSQTPSHNGKTSHIARKVRQRGVGNVVRAQKQNVEALKLEPQSQDSDSDDSVDRGIEEAIQEYLKEKGDPKQSVKLNSSPLQTSKQLKRNFPPSETPKFSDSNNILAASNYVPKSLKASFSTAMETKTFEKDKLGGNCLVFNRTDVNKAQVVRNTDELTSHSKKVQPPLVVKEEEKITIESSSDDGIEEAIWHYQLEKRKKDEDSQKVSKVFQAKEESESSSDDGIEEAIRHYQLEKQKEERENTTKAFKSSHPKPNQGGKSAALISEKHSNQGVRKQKISSKKRLTDKLPKFTSPSAVTPGQGLNTLFDKMSLFKNQSLLPFETPVPLKVNTTAELMCAEAILDISKTVMPRAFEQTLFPTKVSGESNSYDADRPNLSDNKSNDSSVDSDDGIEQEIRKFLELKAQMHKQQPDDTKSEKNQANDICEKNTDSSQNKKLKPPLCRKRKRKEEHPKSVKGQGEDHKIKEPVSLTWCDGNVSVQGSQNTTGAFVVVDVTTETTGKSPDQECCAENQNNANGSGANEGISHFCTVKNDASESTVWTGQRGESGDKSSSLDSDEDLDAAIKDLLKTKKRVKKKTRERKVKSRKKLTLGGTELSHEEESKKNLVENKIGSNPKTFNSSVSKNCEETSKQTVAGKRKMSKVRSKLMNRKVKPSVCGDAQGPVAVETSSGGTTQIMEDSSSVDSDDSIEQEIRKFLAEKAKVCMVSTSTEEVSTADYLPVRSKKLETQQAEISPTLKPPYSDLPERSGSVQHQCREGELLQSSPPDLYCAESIKNDQAGREMDPLKTQKRNRVTLEETGIQSGRPEVERWKSAVNASHFNSNTDTRQINYQLIPSTETVVFHSQSQKLSQCSKLIPHRDHVISVTSTTYLHSAVSRHQDKGTGSVEETCHLYPITGNYDSMNRHKLMSPCKHSSEMALTASLQYPTCLPPDRQYKHEFVREGCRGHLGTTTLSGHVPFPEETAHGIFHVQVRNRDLSSRVEDGKYCCGEMVDRKQAEGEPMRQDKTVCVEVGFEPCEERSANQRCEQSPAQPQHPSF